VSCSSARTSYVDFLPILRWAAQQVSDLLVHSGAGPTLRPLGPRGTRLR
jgi:hypothetical protein